MAEGAGRGEAAGVVFVGTGELGQSSVGADRVV